MVDVHNICGNNIGTVLKTFSDVPSLTCFIEGTLTYPPPVGTWLVVFLSPVHWVPFLGSLEHMKA